MKNKLLRLSLLLVTMIIANTMMARQLTVNEALQRLQQSGSAAKGMNKAAQVKMQLAYTAQQDGTNTFYIVNKPSQQGMMLISADDCVPALLGYTDSGEFTDINQLPEQMRWWLSQYNADIAKAIAQGETAKNTTAVSHDAIAPLIHTTWHQSAPFNGLCNDVEEGSVTGCVATAMSQIMNYYEYPATGTGNHTYTYTTYNDDNAVSGTYEISSDFASHTYDWSNMKNYYRSAGSNTAESEEAVALLMRDCGVAVDMAYSAEGSGACFSMIPYALMTYFGYDKAINNLYRNTMTDDEWENILLSELEAGRPVLYGGADAYEGGHAFICDGYDGEGKYHFNWGWGGAGDGYFLVTGTHTLDPFSYAFTGSQEIITGIQPENGGELTPAEFSMTEGFKIKESAAATEFSDSLTIDKDNNNSFYYVCCILENHSTRPVDATLALKFVSEENTFFKELNSEGTYDLQKYYTDEAPVDISDINVSGTYSVYPVFIDKSADDEWHVIQQPTGFTIPKVTIKCKANVVTAVEEMENGELENENSAVYNLNGQRLNAAQNGINIINGKKYFEKK